MKTKNVLAGPILVPLDGSAIADQALGYAKALAPTGCRIALLRVVPDLLEFPSAWQKFAQCVEEAASRYEDAASKMLTASAGKYFSGRDLERVETMVEFGPPAGQILKIANRIGASMIIMSSYGIGTIDRPALGSVADRVSRGANIPVLLMRPQAHPQTKSGIDRLVVPLDGSSRAEAAVGVAVDLAKQLHVPVQLVTVVDPTRDFPESPAHLGALSGGFQKEIESGLATEAEEYLRGISGDVLRAKVPVRYVVRYGSTAQVLIDDGNPGDLIVMTSHGRSGQPHWELGGIATRLLRDGKVPVLRVRPLPPAEMRVGAEATFDSESEKNLTV